ncbi:MAG: anaerobic ribonucleoside-triphosphate reductase activating protein [Lachnospiraceae bacterium]|nr:anaerobic ribonucleoside-triphosphate reductase activating protein [Lachnospiraceae bacterium]
MLILGLNKTTLLDYPNRVAATLFTGGCNFRCPYCHNKDIVRKSESITPVTDNELFSFLKKRCHVLTGVCITGGEPTLYSDLPEFIRRIKELGYLVKLDTNGTNPDMLQALIHDGLIDYCAMDIKNSPDKYGITIGLAPDQAASFDLSPIHASIQLLMTQKRIPYEFRTTIVQELHEENDMCVISEWIAGAEAYFLQSYTDSEGVLCPGFHAHDEETLRAYAALCKPLIPNVMLRGI